MSLIEISHLRKEYPNITPLKDVSASIEPGEVISLIGPSGTGKTTLLRCLIGLERPTSGSVVVDGLDITDPASDLASLRRSVGMVFQNYVLFEHKLVAENIMMAPMDLLGVPAQQAYDRAIELLQTVGLADKALAWPHELSGGQRQRVAIARALAMDPKVLLFDEPTSALDPPMIAEVLNVIAKLANRGLTMLVVTHELSFAQNVSSRVFFMNEGELWEEGTPDQIFSHPRRKETHDFVFSVRSFAAHVDSLTYDYPSMMANLEEYCARQFIGVRQTHACLMLIDDLVCDRLDRAARLSGVTDPSVHILVSAGERGVDLNVTLDYRKIFPYCGAVSDLGDDISTSLIAGITEEIEVLAPGVECYHLR